MSAPVPDTPPPVPIRPAATVMMVRDADGGPEVLMMQRHALSDGHGGSYVFPGGKVDPADARLPFDERLDDTPERLHRSLGDPEIDATTAAALHIAAVRETFEECNVLLAHDLDADRLMQLALLAAGGMAFNDLLDRFELRLDTRSLCPWSRWITPERSITSPGKRFDTRFFIAEAPAHQIARHDEHEAIDCAWLRPRAALEAYWRGDIVLAPPQIMSLAHLGHHASVASMLAEGRSRPPYVIRPHAFEFDGTRAMAYPGDALHPETPRVMPGPSRLLLRGKRLEPPGGFDEFWG
ncbi:MAG: NUDIX domain-containing protein [Gammaproteobacteria bacterium]|nr:NUDIX domain-containing protein [Gammaproteobacteria bacterium]MBU2408418.1 NUDIX domain-containing protein [Gammaproteobacteria bacterium]